MKFIKIIVFSLSILSCKSEDNKNNLNSSDNFEKIFVDLKIESLKSDIIDFNQNSLVIGRITDMKYINNTLFMLDFPPSYNCIKGINLETKKTLSLIKLGRGPNELNRVDAISTDPFNDRLYASSGKKIFVFNTPDILKGVKEPELIFEVDTPNLRIAQGVFCVGDNIISATTAKDRFLLYDFKNNKSKKRFDWNHSFLKEQGYFVSHPKKKLVAYIQVYNANITFVDYSGKEITKKDFVWWKSNLSVKTTANNVRKLNAGKNLRKSFIHSTCSSKYLYNLYTGKEMKRKSKDFRQSNKVFVFDWEGNPIKTIMLDREVSSIAIDEDREVLYASSENNDGELELIKFSLN